MPRPALRSLPLLLISTLALACSGDDTADTGAGTDTSTSDATDTTSATGSTGGSTTSASDSDSATGSTSTTSTTSTTGSTSGSTTDSSGTAGACSSVVVTYNLTGSTIAIDAIADFTITVQEPYDADLNTGPGVMRIRFADDGNGNPVAGSAQVIEYSLVQNFVTGNALATVTTNIDSGAGPDGCGVAAGSYGADLLTWDDPAEMAPYCRDGMVSCMGGFCGQGGSPPDDMPLIFDNDCTVAHPLGTFTFSNGVDNFSAASVISAMDNNQTTTVTFVGTATATAVDMNTPACACP